MMRWSLIAVAVLAAFAGCTNDPFDPESLGNKPPVARISVDHVETIAPTSYTDARFAWSGSDADGFVVGFWVAISIDDTDPDWLFTTDNDTTATYQTRADGSVVPTLHVVAVDDRGAPSDTARVQFPLVNSPPVVEYQEEFVPPTQSFRAIDLDFFTFDIDGDETLLDHVHYRYEGSDPDLFFDADDSLADPTEGWVRAPRPRRGFRLRLRDVPPGEPALGDEQTVYMRVADDAGAATVFTHTWRVPPVRGSVLLVDDDDSVSDSRDAFFGDAARAHFGDAFNTIEATNLRGEPEVFQATFEPFETIIWYVKRQGSRVNLENSREALTTFLSSDRDPDTPGVQAGQLYLDYQYVGTPAQSGGLNDLFREQYLHVLANPLEGSIVGPPSVIGETGPELDILAQVPGLPDLVYTGTGSVTYFDVWPIGPASDAQPLYRFESARWNSRRCRTGCEPVVASRWPATGDARVVVMSPQIELANDLGNAQEALRLMWSGQMGLEPVDGARPMGGGR